MGTGNRGINNFNMLIIHFTFCNEVFQIIFETVFRKKNTCFEYELQPIGDYSCNHI